MVYSRDPINSPWTLNYFRKILPPGRTLLGPGRLTFFAIFAAWTLNRNLIRIAPGHPIFGKICPLDMPY